MDQNIVKETFLTTNDNPYNPFEDFEHWFRFDVEKGYNTCEKLARLLHVEPTFSDFERIEATVSAINDLLSLDFENKYIVVEEEEFDKLIVPGLLVH